jgi:hypothetical protein
VAARRGGRDAALHCTYLPSNYRVYRGGSLVGVGDGDVTAVDTKCVLAIVVGS